MYIKVAIDDNPPEIVDTVPPRNTSTGNVLHFMVLILLYIHQSSNG